MDDIFFWMSKVFWILASPYSIMCFWLGLGVFFIWKKKQARSFALLMSLFVLLLFVGIFPVGDWVLSPLENEYPENPALSDVQGIIVLSGAENPWLSEKREQAVLNDTSERLLAFMTLARKFPEAQLIFSGGSGSLLQQASKGADVAERVFVDQGFDMSRIDFERKSRNTYENALFSEKLVTKKSARWVLITSSWHLPRAMKVFCKVGWKVIPYPVDFHTVNPVEFSLDWNIERSLRLLSMGVKEKIGYVVYRVTDKAC